MSEKDYPVLHWAGRIGGGIIVGLLTYGALWWAYSGRFGEAGRLAVSLAFGMLTVAFGGKFFEMIIGSDDLY